MVIYAETTSSQGDKGATSATLAIWEGPGQQGRCEFQTREKFEVFGVAVGRQDLDSVRDLALELNNLESC
jgi:hypothetical protein